MTDDGIPFNIGGEVHADTAEIDAYFQAKTSGLATIEWR
jgi:hypothetical protein